MLFFIIIIALVFRLRERFSRCGKLDCDGGCDAGFYRRAWRWRGRLFLTFIAFVVFGTAVAKTIGGDMVNITAIAEDYRLYVLLAGALQISGD